MSSTGEELKVKNVGAPYYMTGTTASLGQWINDCIIKKSESWLLTSAPVPFGAFPDIFLSLTVYHPLLQRSRPAFDCDALVCHLASNLQVLQSESKQANKINIFFYYL